jgi:hypothetical protein
LDGSARIKSRIKEKIVNHLFKDVCSNDFELYKQTRKVLSEWLKRIKYSTSTWVKEKEQIGFYYIDDIFYIKKDKIEFLDNAYYVGLSYEDLSYIGINILFNFYNMEYNDSVIELLYDITTKKYTRNYKIENIFGEDEDIDIDIDFYSYVMKRNVGINDKFKNISFKKIYT